MCEETESSEGGRARGRLREVVVVRWKARELCARGAFEEGGNARERNAPLNTTCEQGETCALSESSRHGERTLRCSCTSRSPDGSGHTVLWLRKSGTGTSRAAGGSRRLGRAGGSHWSERSGRLRRSSTSVLKQIGTAQCAASSRVQHAPEDDLGTPQLWLA